MPVPAHPAGDDAGHKKNQAGNERNSKMGKTDGRKRHAGVMDRIGNSIACQPNGAAAGQENKDLAARGTFFPKKSIHSQKQDKEGNKEGGDGVKIQAEMGGVKD